MSFAKVDDTWEYDEDNEIPMNQDTVQSTADAIRQMEAVRELENPDQLSDYGLDKPSYTIQFQDNDGVTTEILIGNGAGENYYATVGDSGKVYTISSDFQNYLQFDLTNLVQYDTVPSIGSGNLKSVTITENGTDTVYEEDDQVGELAGGFGALSLTDCVNYHASAEELKIMLTIVQPKAFMPVHGEATHLRAHARLAEAVGVPAENVFICENGESLELSTKGVKHGEFVQSGIVLVDGLSVGDTSEQVLEERTALSAQGFAAIAAAVSGRKKAVAGNVQVEMHGITGGDDGYLVQECEKCVKNALTRALSKGASGKELKKSARDALLSLLWERTKTRPMTVVNLLDI